mgnify:CR=1 FL=1|jgi:hypothetical protein|tara:strand:+ start:397 stop:726 length:330 start_codon:yes stop_codon:yes gene_type:complete
MNNNKNVEEDIERLKGYYNDPNNGINTCFLLQKIKRLEDSIPTTKLNEVRELMTHMFELDIDNCTMTHSQWIAEVAEALTDKNYLSDLVKDYRVYLSEREIEFNFKHLK